jgi:hypothetical protein
LTEAEAIEDIRLGFGREYSPLEVAISRLAVARDKLIDAILVVDQALWPDTPNSAVFIELVTATLRRDGIARAPLTTAHTATLRRRHGIARAPLTTAVAHTAGHAALRVA